MILINISLEQFSEIFFFSCIQSFFCCCLYMHTGLIAQHMTNRKYVMVTCTLHGPIKGLFCTVYIRQTDLTNSE